MNGGGRRNGRGSREKGRVNSLLGHQGQGLKPLPAYPVPSSTRRPPRELPWDIQRGGGGAGKLRAREWDVQGCMRSKDVRGCLQTPVGCILEDSPRPTFSRPRLSPCKGFASAGSTAAPAVRGSPRGAELPLRPGSPAGESLRAGFATAGPSCRVRKCRGPRRVPQRGPRLFGSPAPPLMLPSTHGTPAEGPLWASPRPAQVQRRGKRSIITSRLLVWVEFFCFLKLFIWKKL